MQDSSGDVLMKGEIILNRVKETLESFRTTIRVNSTSFDVTSLLPVETEMIQFIKELNRIPNPKGQKITTMEQQFLSLYCNYQVTYMQVAVQSFSNKVSIFNQPLTNTVFDTGDSEVFLGTIGTTLNFEIALINQFIQDHYRRMDINQNATITNRNISFSDIELLKNQIQNQLKHLKTHLYHELTRAPEDPLEYFFLAARYVCRICDLAITAIAWGLDELRLSVLNSNYVGVNDKETIGWRSPIKSMGSTYTPGAKTLIGRDHFLNRPASKEPDHMTLNTAMDELNTALDNIQDAQQVFCIKSGLK